MPNTILLFVKYPQPGRVKTRIAATVGADAATAIYKELVARVWAQLPADAAITVCYDPAERGEEVRAWLPGAARYEAQAAGDLGVRLRVAVGSAFAKTWERLDHAELVLGPTDDGGYYLIAMRRPMPALFENIRWSTEHTLADTLAQAGAAPTHLLPRLRDVDTHEDWLAVGTAR